MHLKSTIYACTYEFKKYIYGFQNIYLFFFSRNIISINMNILLKNIFISTNGFPLHNTLNSENSRNKHTFIDFLPNF